MMHEIPDSADVVIQLLREDKVLRTKRETLCRRVQLNRSIQFVLPLLLPTDRCLDC